MRDSPESTVRTYLVIWAWLAGLMFIGVLLSELHIDKRTIVLAVLGLSSIKAVLVALYYMHLKMDRKLLTWILLAPLTIIGLVVAHLSTSRFFHF